MATTEKHIGKLLLEDKAQVGKALRKAVRHALFQHKRAGYPVAA